MALIAAGNNRYITKDQLRASGAEGARSVFPTNDDWIKLVATDFSYVNSGKVLVSNFDPLTLFMPGQRFRVKQNGATAWSYFGLWSISNDSHIYLYGGDDYTVTNHSFDQVEYSKIAKPVNFPPYFNDEPVYFVQTGTVAFTGGGSPLLSIMEVNVNIDGTISVKAAGLLEFTSPPTALYLVLPIQDGELANNGVNDSSGVTFTVPAIYSTNYTAEATLSRLVDGRSALQINPQQITTLANGRYSQIFDYRLEKKIS